MPEKKQSNSQEQTSENTSQSDEVKTKANNEIGQTITVEQAIAEVEECVLNNVPKPLFSYESKFVVPRRAVVLGVHSELLARSAHFAFVPDQIELTKEQKTVRLLQESLEDAIHNSFNIEPICGLYQHVVPFDCGIGVRKILSQKPVLATEFNTQTAIIDYIIRPNSSQIAQILFGQLAHTKAVKKNKNLDIGQPRYQVGTHIIQNPVYCPIFHPQLLTEKANNIQVGKWLDEIGLPLLNYQLTVFGVQTKGTKEYAFQTITVKPQTRKTQIVEKEYDGKKFPVQTTTYSISDKTEPFTRINLETEVSARGYLSPAMIERGEQPHPFVFTRISHK
jgi:hypothetical protein